MSKDCKYGLTAAVIIALICLLPTIALSAPFKVIRVADGDTITVTQNGSKLKIRLVGIDAPEFSKKKHLPAQPFSQKSKEYLASIVLNKKVDISPYGKDRYGRILGVVFVDGKNVNLEMIKAGLAEVYRGTPAPGFDNEPYQKAESEARNAVLGIWELRDQYFSPKDWREMYRY